jgi:hypothetical protein
MARPVDLPGGLRTVWAMDLCVVSIASGRYILREDLDVEARELLASRARRDGIADELDEDVVEMLVEEARNEAACWWFAETGCGGVEECQCGPVTLLEVLTHAEAAERDGIVEAHVTLLSATWDHYWSGQALMNPDAGELGAACAACIVDGPDHVYDVLEVAETLATELGEALAAFSTRIRLGELRWDDRTGQ